MFEWAFGGLSATKARSLAHQGRDLDLRDIKTLDAPVARILATNHGALYLNGIEKLSKEAETALSEHAGKMSLDGLLEMHTEELAEKFIRQRSWSLVGIELLSHDAQEVFARAPCEVYFPYLRVITSAALARKFVQDDCRAGNDGLVFERLERLSPDAAEEFAQYDGVLDFPRLSLWEMAADAVRLDPLGAYKKKPYARLMKKMEESGGM